MCTIFSQVLQILIMPSAIAALVTYFLTEYIKNSVKNDFDEKLEKLKKEHNIEISKFQTELNSLKTKENFKFTKLHEKRFEILEKSYMLINEVLNEFYIYSNPMKFIPAGKEFLKYEDELQESFLKKHSEFSIYYVNNRIYFDDDTKTLINNYLTDLREAYDLYNKKHFFQILGEKVDRETMFEALQAFKNIESKINPIKLDIEKRFSEILEK